jgi:hypothetical protein
MKTIFFIVAGPLAVLIGIYDIVGYATGYLDEWALILGAFLVLLGGINTAHGRGQ